MAEASAGAVHQRESACSIVMMLSEADRMLGTRRRVVEDQKESVMSVKATRAPASGHRQRPSRVCLRCLKSISSARSNGFQCQIVCQGEWVIQQEMTVDAPEV